MIERQLPLASTLRRLSPLACAAAIVLWMGCGPSLKGTWEASGYYDEDVLLSMKLFFESDERGVAAQTGSTSKAAPVCRLMVVERNVSFQMDPETGTSSCATLQRPLTFKGVLGAHVIVGTVHDPSGNKVGLWRAYRKEQP